jgi:NADPH-dependent ferric siderophore reductase
MGPAFHTQVVNTHQVTTRMLRVTLGGGDLADFAPAGPDQFVYVSLPTAAGSLPAGGAGLGPEDGGDRHGGYYTVRRHRPERAELDIDMVLYGDGACSTWAAAAQPGDPVVLSSPSATYAPPAGTDWRLLVADETGLPAVGAILESLAPGEHAHAFVEIEDEDEEQRLTTHGDVEITWLPRFGVPPGTPPLLIEAVREWLVPPGDGYVWGGGESRAMALVRRHVQLHWELSSKQVAVNEYWRHSMHADDPVDGA